MSYRDSVAESLWNLDEKQLRLQLDGILRLPDIRAVEVREGGTTDNPVSVRLSRDSGKSDLARDYPLHYNGQGRDRVIGSLRVEATLANIYRRSEESGLTILASQAAQTFLVALFIFYVFHHFVTRHLSAMATDIGNHSINEAPLQLRLRRRPPWQEDELQRVVTAFNALSHNAHIAYRDLADREAKIRRFVDANIVGMFFWDFEGRVLEANDAFLDMLGYGRDDLAAGRIGWRNLTPPEWHDSDARLIEEIKLTGRLPPFEKEYFRKDGTRAPVLIGLATLEEGGNQGVAFVLDLSEHKSAEKALRDSEERFRTLMQFSFDVYWETDAQHRFVRQDFSERVTDGPLPDSELGKRRWELPYFDIDEEGWRKHREMLDAHLPFRDLEYGRPTPSGGKRWATVSGLPLFDEAGRFIGYRGVARHITERKLIEEALRQREKELREIVETIPAMTVTITADGRDAFIGKRFSEYSGLSVEEARGSGWKVAVHPDDLDLYLRTWRASLASGDPMEFETRVRRADGEYRWFLARAAPQRDEAGNVIRWYEVLTDIDDRKRAESILYERDARIRRLVDANLIGVFTWQIDRHDGVGDAVIRDVNDAFLRIVGYNREDLISASVGQRSLTPPEWRDRTERAMAEMKLNGSFKPYEKEYIRKDGRRVPVLIGAAQFDESAEQGVAFVIDLTEQKKAEQALKRSEAYLIEAQRLSHTGSFAYDPARQKTLFWSDELFRIFGLDPRHGIPDYETTRRLVHPDDLGTVSATCLQGFREKVEFSQTYRLLLRDGVIKYLHAAWHPVLDETGEVVEYIGTAADVTERENAEQNRRRTEVALRESEEQWKAVFENNPVMYFMVDETRTIMSVNSFGAEQLGYAVNDLIGRPLQIVSHEADRETAQKNIAICFERPGQAMSWELRKVRKSGEAIWVRETGRATVINGRLVLLIVCEDVTEGKRAAEALSEIQTELAHANRVTALGQLAASIAHEVNQPIAAAHNNAGAALNFLDRTPPHLEDVREALRCVLNDTQRAGDVMSGLRAIVKKEPPQTTSFDINDAIREVIVITRGEAAKNVISVKTRLAEGLPLVQGVRVRIQQVALNLIINAIEAMSAVDDGTRELLVSTEQSQEGGVLIAVRDSGPGIDANNVERIFESFFTTKSEGIGIGLSICRSIVEAHGGRLWASANAPRGAMFQFTVPSP